MAALVGVGMGNAAVNDGRLALALTAASARRRADPLSRFTFASPIHRRVPAFLLAGVEVHHRAAGFGGKTQNGAAWVASFLAQRDTLDGEPMPVLGRRVTGGILVASYEGQKDSSQKALREWVGDWPHHEAMADSGRDIVSTLWVKPHCKRGGGSDWHSDAYSTWSRASFISQANSSIEAVRGQRWDFAWGDEPPIEAFWREVRKNARHLLITETPLEIGEWEWIQRDFLGCLGAPFQGRVEIVSALDDNRHLTDEHKATLRERYRNDPFARARLFGEYVDVSGACPFDYARLQQLLSWSEPGEEAAFDPRVVTWRDRDPAETYMVLLDPSAGIRPTADSQGGDSCVLWVGAVGARAGVARYFGHEPPAELARLGLAAARHYGDALIVPETNGIGEAMLPVFEGYRNVYREYALERYDHALSGRVGWYQTEQTKAAVVGSLITALADGWLDIPSADAVRSLLAIRTDDRGKLVRRPHQNHEDMIALGMFAYLLQHPLYAGRSVAREQAPESLAKQLERAVAESQGRRVRHRRGSVVEGAPERWR